jgi:hypothetical protein
MAPCPYKGCGKPIQEYEFKQYLKDEQKTKLEQLVNSCLLN